MDILSDDIILKVLYFLSSKEKLSMREVNSTFTSIINPLLLTIYKLDSLMKNIYTIESKLLSELQCYLSYNNYTFFVPIIHNTIHRLFRINNTPIKFDKCIVDTCREKRLGLLYCSRTNLNDYIGIQLQTPIYFDKKNIPYCSNCFNLWNIRKFQI